MKVKLRNSPSRGRWKSANLPPTTWWKSNWKRVLQAKKRAERLRSFPTVASKDLKPSSRTVSAPYKASPLLPPWLRPQVHLNDPEFRLKINFRAHFQWQAKSAALDAAHFVRNVAVAYVEQHKTSIQHSYVDPPVEYLLLPSEVAHLGLTGQQLLRTEAEHVVEQCTQAQRVLAVLSPSKAPTVRNQYNVLKAKFKFKRWQTKIAEVWYHFVLDVQLPMRHPELEARLLNVHRWAPGGVEVEYDVHVKENFAFQYDPKVIENDPAPVLQYDKKLDQTGKERTVPYFENPRASINYFGRVY
eukprot:NODE_2168_length_1122_cov_72.401005_g2150_i0.p1 GENE.NODE_2168_length_1122_cov_72.401005_g2150_i0~~NODE_2168_length_1122_cov_72.401005_g2150_i0.p1  ORF type:complete len:331 (-),score=42.38 NODE_2168_length_1122_cov_72.401005_g2150_i0:128-1027(-)